MSPSRLTSLSSTHRRTWSKYSVLILNSYLWPDFCDLTWCEILNVRAYFFVYFRILYFLLYYILLNCILWMILFLKYSQWYSAAISSVNKALSSDLLAVFKLLLEQFPFPSALLSSTFTLPPIPELSPFLLTTTLHLPSFPTPSNAPAAPFLPKIGPGAQCLLGARTPDHRCVRRSVPFRTYREGGWRFFRCLQSNKKTEERW